MYNIQLHGLEKVKAILYSNFLRDILKDLSLPRLIKLSSTGQLICRLRIDNEAVIDCLTKDSRIEALQSLHTGIILSTDLLNSLSGDEPSAT